MRRSLTASVALLALAAVAGTALGAESVPARQQQRARTIGREALAYYGNEISRFRKETWHWQRLMGVPLTPPGGRQRMGAPVGRPTGSPARGGNARRRRTRGAAPRPHLRGSLHPPLRGRLDGHRRAVLRRPPDGPRLPAELRRLALRPKGTADHWSPLEQIWTAEKALKSRGFWPWPNTARYCGLL